MMDGFGIRYEAFSGGLRRYRVTKLVAAGAVGSPLNSADEAVRIMTGAAVPPGVDLVIPIEFSQHDDATNVVTFPDLSVRPNLNVILQGDNKRIGERLLSAGTKLLAQHIGALAEFGISLVPVRPRPTVSILATGDELVPYDQSPSPTQIRNSNELMLAAQVTQAGGVPVCLGIARDTTAQLTSAIQTGLKSHVLLLTGGVSAGDFDLVPPTLKALGVTEVFHKIQLKPGKPLWFGVYQNSHDGHTCYVFGLPGNPVSSLVCFELFVRPSIEKLMGLPGFPLTPLTATLQTDFVHRGDRPTHHPACLTYTPLGLSVEMVAWKGSSDLSATIAANCTIAFPPGNTTYVAGSHVQVYPWASSIGTIL